MKNNNNKKKQDTITILLRRCWFAFGVIPSTRAWETYTHGKGEEFVKRFRNALSFLPDEKRAPGGGHDKRQR